MKEFNDELEKIEKKRRTLEEEKSVIENKITKLLVEWEKRTKFVQEKIDKAMAQDGLVKQYLDKEIAARTQSPPELIITKPSVLAQQAKDRGDQHSMIDAFKESVMVLNILKQFMVNLPAQEKTEQAIEMLMTAHDLKGGATRPFPEEQEREGEETQEAKRQKAEAAASKPEGKGKGKLESAADQGL